MNTKNITSVSVYLESRTSLKEFPWVKALFLYILSWSWPLLRPNTFYWDDWSFYFARTLSYSREIHNKDFGRPPWGKVIEELFLHIGPWLVTLGTFVGLFVVGLLLFEILYTIPEIGATQRCLIVLLFLIVPVNHARVCLTIFDYTSSYVAFFTGWLILARSRSTRSFITAAIILFFSFKTHSILFFNLLPFAHFLWLRRFEIYREKFNFRYLTFPAVLGLLPILYLLLRSKFWSLIPGDVYQQPTTKGFLVGIYPLALSTLFLVGVALRIGYFKRPVRAGFILLAFGFFAVSLALFPYFLAELYVGYAGRPAYITVFEFRADWRSRHQLLMPLGLALSVVGLNELFKWKRYKNIFAGFIVVVSVALNMFWGSQYFLQSHKQEQLVELFKSTKGNLDIASVGDQTLRFNGRENDFRGYEWDGFMTLAGIPTERPGCEALPDGSVVVLKSDKPYLKALVSRDLGLYFDVTPCSEVLAKDG